LISDKGQGSAAVDNKELIMLAPDEIIEGAIPAKV
jgi:hypothetical protein